MISKERLNELVLEVNESMPQRFQLIDFAHALIKAVEAESEVVGYFCNETSVFQRQLYEGNNPSRWTPLFAIKGVD
jgi:hypothetical protein